MLTMDIDYARSIFTDLIAAWTTKTSIPPGPSDTHALAKKALEIAGAFAAARRESQASSQGPGSSSGEAEGTHSDPKLAEVAKLWMERVVKRTAGNSRQVLQSRFQRFVLPQLGSRPIGRIEPSEILSVLRSIEHNRSADLAYRIFQDLHFLYRYAIGAGLVDRDPTSILRPAIAKPKHKGARTVLDRETIGGLLRAIREYAGKPRSTARHMLRLAPMLFLRPSELRTLEWRDVDLDAATVVIPASRMKMGYAHVVPVARQAVLLLREVQSITGSGRFVFTSGRTDKPLDHSIFYVMLKSMGFGRVATAHGFRVLAATCLDSLGWRAEVIERQLSHAGGRRSYSRADSMPERRRMMQAWADELERLEYANRQRDSRKNSESDSGQRGS